MGFRRRHPSKPQMGQQDKALRWSVSVAAPRTPPSLPLEPPPAVPRNPTSPCLETPPSPRLETPGEKIWDQNSDRFLQYANVPVREKAKHNSFAAVGYAVNYNEWTE